MNQRSSFVVLMLVLLGLSLLAGSGLGAESDDVNVVYDPALFEALEYRLIGPFRGGRVTAVTGVPSQPGTFYMGSTGGRVWKTTDSGTDWRNVSDGYFEAGSMGAVAVALSDPNVVYAGTGSACIRGNVSPGIGVYKSVDAGATWSHVGLRDAGQVARVRIHPKNPEVVYVAALGHAFGPNEERGIRDVPGRRRRSVPLSRLRAAAGQQHDLRAEPHALGRYHAAALDRRGRRRERLDRGRPKGPRHHLCGQLRGDHRPRQPPNGPRSEHHGLPSDGARQRRPRPPLSLPVERPDTAFASRPRRVVPDVAIRPPLDRPRPELGSHQSRPDAERPREAGLPGPADHERRHRRRGLRRHLLVRGVAPRAGRALGRLRRRARPRLP